MTKRLELYHCAICGNLVEVFNGGIGELYCCGAPMDLLQPKTTDEMAEKHVPVIEKQDDGSLKIKVGSVEHPMEDSHYIMMIEMVSDDKSCAHVKFLHPHEHPQAIFENKNDKEFYAREYCNVHGLWASK